MKLARTAAFAVALALACSATSQSASAQDQNKAQIDALRKAMEKYKDYKVAVIRMKAIAPPNGQLFCCTNWP